MKKTLVYTGVIVAFLITIAVILSVLLSPTAGAGIGPSGFAYYARQGIVNELNKVYGKGNSPYVVTCQDHPNYQTISDNVTCQVREK